jgi:hypothetical protein
MKLVASLIVHNERDRYLEPCLSSLLGFCDAVAIVDDGSTDGTYEWLRDRAADSDGRIALLRNDESVFFEHEGKARQALLDWTLKATWPTHVLAIDADEFVASPQAIRDAIAASPAQEVWTLEMEEVWEAADGGYAIRQDGGWKAHPVGVLWRVPPTRRSGGRQWEIPQRALACGRVPQYVARHRRARPVGSSLLHVGWACEADRVARHHRYAVADGGRFHAGSHLDSILWTGSRVRLEHAYWPDGMTDDTVGLIVDRARRGDDETSVPDLVEPSPYQQAIEGLTWIMENTPHAGDGAGPHDGCTPCFAAATIERCERD